MLGRMINCTLDLFNLRLGRSRPRTMAGRKAVIRFGKYSVELPADNPLANMYLNNPRYSFELARIAAAVGRKYANGVLIDVGANVGDTAALLRNVSDLEILAIEGDQTCFEFLERNVKPLTGVRVLNHFLADVASDIQVAITKEGWNTTLQPDQHAGRHISFLTLDNLLKTYSQLASTRFIKVDTEGFDLKIIRGASAIIEASHPVFFFEANRENLDPLNERLDEFFQWLRQRQYKHLIFWDSIGRFITAIPNEDGPLLTDLIAYAKTPTAVGYFDICAVHVEDYDVFADLVASERAENHPALLDGASVEFL